MQGGRWGTADENLRPHNNTNNTNNTDNTGVAKADVSIPVAPRRRWRRWYAAARMVH